MKHFLYPENIKLKTANGKPLLLIDEYGPVLDELGNQKQAELDFYDYVNVRLANHPSFAQSRAGIRASNKLVEQLEGKKPGDPCQWEDADHKFLIGVLDSDPGFGFAKGPTSQYPGAPNETFIVRQLGSFHDTIYGVSDKPVKKPEAEAPKAEESSCTQ